MGSFRKATKQQSRLRMAICGPAKSGKSFSALRFAHGMCKRIAVINAEAGDIQKYLGMSPDDIPFEFDVVDLNDFSPTRYTQLILEAGRDGYDGLIIDSLSHAWVGTGGALEIKDKKGGNSFTAWKDVTPMHNQMLDAILRSPCHVWATMRSKMEYVLEDEVDPKTGAKKCVPRKIGLAPVQRAGVEYEFDILADMDWTHTMTVSGSRCPTVDGAVLMKPGAAFMIPVKKWLEEGIEVDPSYFATQAAQLPSTNEINTAQQQVQAAETRRQQLLAMAQEGASTNTGANAGANGSGNGNGNGHAETAVASDAEQPPFDTNQPAPLPTDERTERITALNELVEAGKAIGRTPKQIQDECMTRLGAKPSDLPIEKLRALIAAFRKAAAAGAAAGAGAETTEAAPKNQTAA